MGWEENKNRIFANHEDVMGLFKKSTKAESFAKQNIILQTTFTKNRAKRIGVQTILYIDKNGWRRTKTITHNLGDSNF